MKYTVTIDRTTVEREEFEVDANSRAEAKKIAEENVAGEFPDFGEVQAIDYEVTLVEETK